MKANERIDEIILEILKNELEGLTREQIIQQFKSKYNIEIKNTTLYEHLLKLKKQNLITKYTKKLLPKTKGRSNTFWAKINI